MLSAVAITFIDRKLGIWMEQMELFKNADGLQNFSPAVIKDILYALILVLIIIYNNAPALKPLREKLSIKKLISKIRLKQGYADDEGKWDRVPTKIEMNEVLSVDVTVVESVQNPDKEEK